MAAKIAGTRGYEDAIVPFAKASQSLRFDIVNKDFLPHVPRAPAHVLDVGAGIGQNTAALAALGHSVIAVEPLNAFLQIARRSYQHLTNIEWVEDSLPDLRLLSNKGYMFDFVLIDAVWHHLNKGERALAMSKLSCFLKPGGICAISLRHGPAGAGKHVFPTDVEETARLAQQNAMLAVEQFVNQPSLLPNKQEVTWSRVVLKRRDW